MIANITDANLPQHADITQSSNVPAHTAFRSVQHLQIEEYRQGTHFVRACVCVCVSAVFDTNSG